MSTNSKSHEDATLASVALTRIAARDPGLERYGEMHEIFDYIYQEYGLRGVRTLVKVMARNHAYALRCLKNAENEMNGTDDQDFDLDILAVMEMDMLVQFAKSQD